MSDQSPWQSKSPYAEMKAIYAAWVREEAEAIDVIDAVGRFLDSRKRKPPAPPEAAD